MPLVRQASRRRCWPVIVWRRIGQPNDRFCPMNWSICATRQIWLAVASTTWTRPTGWYSIRWLLNWKLPCRRLLNRKAAWRDSIVTSRHVPPRRSRLGCSDWEKRLDEVWYDPAADGRLKQQIVRVLIEHVFAPMWTSQAMNWCCGCIGREGIIRSCALRVAALADANRPSTYLR